MYLEKEQEELIYNVLSDKLKKHQKIGIDLDYTLICSDIDNILKRYIHTHPNKFYYIVTFRTFEDVDNIPHVLKTRGINIKLFKKILTVPEDIFIDYINGKENGNMNMTYEYREWKGKICKENNISVLIDDLPEDVILGCNKYRIKFIDTNEIL